MHSARTCIVHAVHTRAPAPYTLHIATHKKKLINHERQIHNILIKCDAAFLLQVHTHDNKKKMYGYSLN
jgi:hypothetical protein